MTQVALETQHVLAQYVAQVNAGEDVVLTQEGRAVARIVPVWEPADIPAPRLHAEEKEAAWAEMLALLERGIPLGGGPAPSKNEMHER